jgi:hypothetical protein
MFLLSSYLKFRIGVIKGSHVPSVMKDNDRLFHDQVILYGFDPLDGP